MIPFASIFLALAIPTVTGFMVCLLFVRGTGFIAAICLGYGLGMGVLSYAMFLMGLLRIPYSLPLITSFLVVLAVVSGFFFYRKGRRLKEFLSPGISADERGGFLRVLLAGAIVIWLALKIVFVFHEAGLRPLYSWDSWTHWAAGAKAFFYERGLMLDYTDDNFMAKAYRTSLGYPLHTPLIEVWIAMWVGSFHEAYVKLFSAGYFVSLLGLFFTMLRKESSWFYALLFTFFLSGVPLITYHATDANAELPVAYYAFAAVVMFWRHIKTDELNALMLSGVFIAMAVFTKNVALVYFVAVGIALMVFLLVERKRFFLPAALFVVSFLVVIGPWKLFMFFNNIAYGAKEQADAAGGGFFDIKLHILGSIVREFLFTINFNLIFAFWFFMTAFFFKRMVSSEIRYINLVVVLVMGMLVYLYITPLFSHYVITRVGIHRHALTYAPIVLFISALLLKDYARGHETKKA
ncbi:MAG: hypothetical protein HY880_06500 [Deltaproteobacteria bacterium]|nr:hypothetical protein [Deltaproteobacteria bacterium]